MSEKNSFVATVILYALCLSAFVLGTGYIVFEIGFLVNIYRDLSVPLPVITQISYEIVTVFRNMWWMIAPVGIIIISLPMLAKSDFTRNMIYCILIVMITLATTSVHYAAKLPINLFKHPSSWEYFVHKNSNDLEKAQASYDIVLKAVQENPQEYSSALNDSPDSTILLHALGETGNAECAKILEEKLQEYENDLESIQYNCLDFVILLSALYRLDQKPRNEIVEKYAKTANAHYLPVAMAFLVQQDARGIEILARTQNYALVEMLTEFSQDKNWEEWWNTNQKQPFIAMTSWQLWTALEVFGEEESSRDDVDLEESQQIVSEILEKK